MYWEKQKEEYLLKAIELENSITQLMFEISSRMWRLVQSSQLMRDNDFIRRKDRTENDIHAFFELRSWKIFHLRAYVRFMLEIKHPWDNQVFLTGYLKKTININKWQHSFRQQWYNMNASDISEEMQKQNPTLFIP